MKKKPLSREAWWRSVRLEWRRHRHDSLATQAHGPWCPRGIAPRPLRPLSAAGFGNQPEIVDRTATPREIRDQICGCCAGITITRNYSRKCCRKQSSQVSTRPYWPYGNGLVSFEKDRNGAPAEHEMRS